MESVAGPRGVGAIELVVAGLDLDCEALAAASACLSREERRRAARFRSARERRRFIAARARLRAELAARLGTTPEAVAIGCGKNGKPALAEPFAASGWCFNVSHSGELALYAFARACELGVDVEAVREVAESAAIAQQVFSPPENARFLSAPAQDRPLEFLRLWTRKEAYAKALGEGIAAPLEAIDVTATPAGWRLESFSPRSGYIAALAARST
jgi:4'-phosphopantetheinyl transferase